MRTVTVSLFWLVLCGCTEGSGSATLTIQGSACAVAVDYVSEAEVPMRVYRDGDGALLAVEVSGGEPFDREDPAAWAAHASEHDDYAMLEFHDPESPTPHSITKLEHSVLAARGVGVIHTGEEAASSIVAIEVIDWSADEIALHYSLAVDEHNSDYPPSEGGMVMCAGDTVTGRIHGAFELVVATNSGRSADQ